MRRPSAPALGLSLLFAPFSAWACMCHNGAAMSCGPNDPDPCAAARAASDAPAPPGADPTKQSPAVDLSEFIKEPPSRPCGEPGGLCYAPEQIKTISQNMAEKYKDVRLNSDNMAIRVLHWFKKSARTEASDLGEVATKVLGAKGVSDGGDISPGKIKAFGDYLAMEKAAIEKIDQLKPGQDRRQTAREAAHELAQAAMIPLERLDTEVHDALMVSGDPLSRLAMSGGDWADREPKNPNAWNQAAQESYGGGRYKDAVDQANKVLEMDPKNADALSLRSSAQFKQGNFPEAARDAKAALQLDPKDQNALGVYQLSAGRGPASGSGDPGQAAPAPSGDASAAASAAVAGAAGLRLASPSLAQSAQYGKKAETAFALGDRRSAIDNATRALDLNPGNLAALGLRAAAHNAVGSHQAALRDAAASLQLNPKNGPMINAKAYALNKLKRYQEALDAANEALALDSRDASALANKAYALGGLGDRAGMLAALKTAAAIDPRFDSSLQSALQVPEDGDVVFLFPGEETAAAPAPGKAAASRGRRFGALSVSTVIGGLLLGLGILPIVLPPLTRRLKTFVTERGTRHPAVTAMRSPADPLRGQYEIIRQIGEGGMGLVYEGKDAALERRVAIKKMRPEVANEARGRAKFLAEARMVAGLHHPNIVDIFAIVEEGDGLFLVFEYVGGMTLFELLARRGRLPLAEAVGLVRGMASALDFAHAKGVIHRDLKPSNVMLDDEGRVKVMDFGIARAAKDATAKFSRTNAVIGTPPYMAPEQEQGVVAKQSDVYSLAVCLYEMLAGRRPFGGAGEELLAKKMKALYEPVTLSAPGLPAALDGLFARAFVPEPEKRFSSAGEFLAALETAAAQTAGL